MHLFLTEEKIHQLLELAKENKRDYALLNMAASTALRSSDLLKIKVKDMLDRDGDIIRMIRLKMKKTGQYIERPLRRDCREAVREYLESREDKNPYLFVSNNRGYIESGKPINRLQYHRAIRKYLSLMYHDSVLQGCSTHTLRRSVAKLVYRKTGTIPPAQHLLGHNNPANTVKYLDPEEIRETANKVVMEDLKW